MAIVTTHAAERYVERFARHLTLDQAVVEIMLSAAIIDAAAAFGATCIKLANGARLMLAQDRVVTVKQSSDMRRAPAPRSMRKRWHKARLRARAA